MQGLWCGCNSSWHLLAQPDMECDMLTIGSWLRLTPPPPSKPLPLILWLWRKFCVVVFGDSWTAVFQLVHTLTHSPQARGPHVDLPLLGQNLLTAHKGGGVKRGGGGDLHLHICWHLVVSHFNSGRSHYVIVLSNGLGVV